MRPLVKRASSGASVNGIAVVREPLGFGVCRMGARRETSVHVEKLRCSIGHWKLSSIPSELGQASELEHL
jgi:hypothetical protein